MSYILQSYICVKAGEKHRSYISGYAAVQYSSKVWGWLNFYFFIWKKSLIFTKSVFIWSKSKNSNIVKQYLK